MESLFIMLMGVLARGAGGGFWANKLNKVGATDDKGKDLGGVMRWDLTWLYELAFAVPFGVAAAKFGVLGFLVAGAIAFLSMQASTGPGIGWGKNPERAKKKQRITPLVEFLTSRLGFATGDVNFCRTWMAVKGFLIGLPVGAIPLMILWPLSYEIGNRLKPLIGDRPGHATAEFLSGCSAAISILIWNHLTA